MPVTVASQNTRFDGRIFGGMVAKDHQYSSLVSVNIKLNPSMEFFCGGVLYQMDEILTAAHCCALSHRPNDISVGAGSNLRSKPNQASSGLQIIQN